MKESKTKQKIDYILWALIWLLPVISYVVTYYRIGNAIPMFEYIDTHFSFGYVKTLLDNIWQKVFSSQLVLSGYISYLIVVEIVHCMFDAVVFIPRLAHGIIEKFTDFAGGK